MRRLARVLAGPLCGVLGGLVLWGGAAVAVGPPDDAGSIAHVETGPDGLQILVNVPAGADLDLSTPAVTIDGEPAEATATVVDGSTPVRRTTVLVIDTSNSMRGARFTAAQAAAVRFIRTVPDDVYVGIVGFSTDVTTLLAPSQDRAQALQVVSALTLTRGTSLYAGVVAAADEAGSVGQRSLIVLSDGADTTGATVDDAVSAVEDNGLIVDAVALDQGGVAVPGLAELAAAGGGQVIPAEPAALTKAFNDEAELLANQVLVTARVPASVVEAGTKEANVQVVLTGADASVTAEAFSPLLAAGAPSENLPMPVVETGSVLPAWAGYAGAGVLGLGLLTVLALLVPAAPAPLSAEERINRYTTVAKGNGAGGGAPRVDADQALNQAREVAADLLGRNKGLEARISKRLEAAGSELRSAEWLLVHGGLFVVAGLVGLLAGRGNVLVGLLFLLVGVFAPWIYLGFRAGRRRKAFQRALPDTLQLMSGSLSAGLSLAQSVDTIVREGAEPVASEFKRVLVETRLGVSLEDAMDGISERFESKDFEWVVMAIRIQRQVGGNLAELLDTVAGTMREREYIRRQVAALAAEGKLSAYVLGGLPPLFLVYLLLTNRDYVIVLFTEPIGWLMLGGGALLLSVGVFWMGKLIKVEV
jgi:tight adherence protein B